MMAVVDAAARVVFDECGRTIAFLVGTMIELPRTALPARRERGTGELFSIGINDLTKTTLGVSRDEASRFFGVYVEKDIYARDPFASLDVEGV
ncbi:PEP-utilizing family enzyme [Sphingomonas sp. BK235]|nr:PEP-utilizing family enzyme [Sphingomonas sp. BK235]